jgi:hypothetical protein
VITVKSPATIKAIAWFDALVITVKRPAVAGLYGKSELGHKDEKVFS